MARVGQLSIQPKSLNDSLVFLRRPQRRFSLGSRSQLICLDLFEFAVTSQQPGAAMDIANSDSRGTEVRRLEPPEL